MLSKIRFFWLHVLRKVCGETFHPQSPSTHSVIAPVVLLTLSAAIVDTIASMAKIRRLVLVAILANAVEPYTLHQFTFLLDKFELFSDLDSVDDPHRIASFWFKTNASIQNSIEKLSGRHSTFHAFSNQIHVQKDVCDKAIQTFSSP